MANLNPWELIKDKDVSQLVFAYEMVLTEMRTHSRGDRLIAEWVKRLDSERDEFVRSASDKAAK
jgi:hypothetical protein